jgi:hypothetical protein
MDLKNNEADVPGPGLDEWWLTKSSSTDAADKEKQAVEAADFQQARTYRYLASCGTDDIGGFGMVLVRQQTKEVFR